jgi:TMEM175 potassium channel family protein
LRGEQVEFDRTTLQSAMSAGHSRAAPVRSVPGPGSVRPAVDPGVVEAGTPPVRESVEFARIVAFTDGVFAIAITLLVLSIEAPTSLEGREIHDYLVDSWRQFFAYFLSFAVIGRFWISHHSLFSLLHDFDRLLMALNLAYLSLIVLIPFPTELLGDFGDRTDAVMLYAAVVGSAALLSWLIVRAAIARGHVHPDVRAEAARQAAGILRPAIVFYASIPIALLSPAVAQLAWLALLLQRPRR